MSGVLDQIAETLREDAVGPEAYPVEGEWVPGDPLWPHPWETNNPDAQVPREMAQVIETYEAPMRCRPCGVAWVGDDPCWMCGEDRPLRDRRRSALRVQQPTLYFFDEAMVEPPSIEDLRRATRIETRRSDHDGGLVLDLRVDTTRFMAGLLRARREAQRTTSSMFERYLLAWSTVMPSRPLTVDRAAYARRRAARRRRSR